MRHRKRDSLCFPIELQHSNTELWKSLCGIADGEEAALKWFVAYGLREAIELSEGAPNTASQYQKLREKMRASLERNPALCGLCVEKKWRFRYPQARYPPPVIH